MAALKLLDFIDIVDAVCEELKIQSTDTVSRNRVKRDINIVYVNEVVPFARWKWLQKQTTVSIAQGYTDGTAAVTLGSSTVTLSTAPAAGLGSFVNRKFSLDSSAEIYTITAHTAGTATLTITPEFNGNTGSDNAYKIWGDYALLPTDCRETVEVWHDGFAAPMEGRGLQEFTKIVLRNPKAAGLPYYYYTGEFKDPTPSDDETETDRARAMWVYPAVYTARTNIHVSYIKEVPELEDDGDEPIIPVEDRVVLLYGALARAWRRERRVQDAADNLALFQQKLSRMAGKMEDTFDKPTLAPESIYIASKRNSRGGNGSGRMATGGGGGGGGWTTSVTYLQDVTINRATVSGDITVNDGILVDGRDISEDGADLDAHIAATAAHGTGSAIVGISDSQTLTNKTIDADSNIITNVDNGNIKAAAGIEYSKLELTDSIVNDDINSAAGIEYSKLDLADSIVNADINSAAAISRNKTASGTAYRILANDVSGVMSENAAITAARAVASDANGQLVASATTATELGYVNLVTGPIQAQIDGKQATGNYITALTSDVTATGPGSVAATIAANAVTNSKLADMATQTIKGRTTAGSGDPEDLTATQATAILDNFVGDSGAGGTKGLVPAPASGDAAANKYLKANGSWAAVTPTFTAPTQQRFTSGTAQTYTTPAGVLYIRVRMVGGGAGGSGGGANDGGASTAGGNTTFGSSLLTANGGALASGGSTAAPGGGGTASVSSPAYGTAVTGGGGAYGSWGLTVAFGAGGTGGMSPFGGPGQTGGGNQVAAVNSAAYGSGGSGGGGTTATNVKSGAGGGAGGFVDAIIASPSATYTYTVGTGGTGGTAGTNGAAGGNGAAGYIEVTEYYQ